jgi:hypothetical protein
MYQNTGLNDPILEIISDREALRFDSVPRHHKEKKAATLNGCGFFFLRVQMGASRVFKEETLCSYQVFYQNTMEIIYAQSIYQKSLCQPM